MLAAVLSLGSQLALAADKVLIVVTSHQQLGNSGEKTGYWLGEVTHPYQKLLQAGFEVDTVSPEVGQAVYFSSCSHNAHEYEWDFGDGVVSYEPDPVHVYTGTGTFEVTLTVYSHTGDSDQTSLMIDVMMEFIRKCDNGDALFCLIEFVLFCLFFFCDFFD